MPLLVKAVSDALAAVPITDGALVPIHYVGYERPQGNFAVTVIPEAGAPPQGAVGLFPQFSVIVRHPDGTKANEVAAAIFKFLHERGNHGNPGTVAFSGLKIGRIFASGDVVNLGFDGDGGQGRWRVIQTFTAILRQT